MPNFIPKKEKLRQKNINVPDSYVYDTNTRVNTWLWFSEFKGGNIIRTEIVAIFLEASGKKPYSDFFNTLSQKGEEGKKF